MGRGKIIISRNKRNFKKVPGLSLPDAENALTLLLYWLKKVYKHCKMQPRRYWL